MSDPGGDIYVKFAFLNIFVCVCVCVEGVVKFAAFLQCSCMPKLYMRTGNRRACKVLRL